MTFCLNTKIIGPNNKEDIDNAVKIFRANDCSFELMHCISTYPMKVEDANLLTIDELKGFLFIVKIFLFISCEL